MGDKVEWARFSEMGLREQTSGGMYRTVPVLRLHVAKPGESKSMCGKSTSDFKPAQDADWHPRNFCRACRDAAAAQDLTMA
jgi:hypothetical protein